MTKCTDGTRGRCSRAHTQFERPAGETRDHEGSFSDIVHQLSRTHAAADRCLRALLAEHELPDIVPAHGDILILLLQRRSMTMKSIADYVGKDPSTITALVQRLIDAGYLQKTRSIEDGRCFEVCLTDKGRELEDQIGAVSRDLIGALERALTANDLMDLKSLLVRVQEAFEEERNAERKRS